MKRTAMACALLVGLPLAGTARADDASAYVVVVDYAADAAHFDQLRTLVLAVARASIAEPGCRRFDVVMPAGIADHLTLYEIFDDKAAFAAHAAMPHFKQFVIDSGAIGATRTATPGAMVLSSHKP